MPLENPFTPTCVGTAYAKSAEYKTITVHPHVRGDGTHSAAIIEISVGSPPRAWGRLKEERQVHPRHRFTPTCVGTATPARHALQHKPVHPHVRGDGADIAWGSGHVAGSPPRAWGRRCCKYASLAS